MMTWLLALLASALAVVLLITGIAVAWLPSIEPQTAQARALAGEMLLLDVRTAKEWQQTGLPDGAEPLGFANARHLPRLDFAAAMRARFNATDTAQPVALTCSHGVRGALAGVLLRLAGYEEVYNVREGTSGGLFGPGFRGRDLPFTPYRGGSPGA